MRLSIVHRATYQYDTPAARVIQVLRLTPRNHDGQFVSRWRVDVSADCRLDQQEDAFGNITHAFTAEGPLANLQLTAEGEVETRDTQGIVRDAAERFPPSLFLRETALTACDAPLAAFAEEARQAAGDDRLKLLHWLLDHLHDVIAFDTDRAHVHSTAAEAFAARRGLCEDHAHVFIAAARSLGIPSRYVSGYFCGDGGEATRASGHAWAEAFVPDLGWVAFDTAYGMCATDTHARVAVGLDHLGAAPVRGSRYGGGGEALSVDIRIDQAFRQTQS